MSISLGVKFYKSILGDFSHLSKDKVIKGKRNTHDF